MHGRSQHLICAGTVRYGVLALTTGAVPVLTLTVAVRCALTRFIISQKYQIRNRCVS